MKSLRILTLIFSLLTLSLSGFAQGIEFFHGTWAEAKAKGFGLADLVLLVVQSQPFRAK